MILQDLHEMLGRGCQDPHGILSRLPTYIYLVWAELNDHTNEML